MHKYPKGNVKCINQWDPRTKICTNKLTGMTSISSEMELSPLDTKLLPVQAQTKDGYTFEV